MQVWNNSLNTRITCIFSTLENMNQQTSTSPSMIFSHHSTIASWTFIHDQSSTSRSFLPTIQKKHQQTPTFFTQTMLQLHPLLEHTPLFVFITGMQISLKRSFKLCQSWNLQSACGVSVSTGREGSKERDVGKIFLNRRQTIRSPAMRLLFTSV